jgi:signal transduction histidine kinase
VTKELETILAREDLIASISHELKNPLTAVIGYLDLALDDLAIQPQTRKQLEVSLDNSTRILDLLNHMLAGISGAGAQSNASMQRTDISKIIEESVGNYRVVSQNQGVEIEIKQSVATFVFADPILVRQVLDNLLSNAVKYNRAKGRVSVETVLVSEPLASRHKSGQPKFLEVRVRDTGRGMTQPEQRSLFDKFYRAKSVRGSSLHGTGLGLNISREIMRKHGGDLRIESRWSVGTTAICQFPIPLEGIG